MFINWYFSHFLFMSLLRRVNTFAIGASWSSNSLRFTILLQQKITSVNMSDFPVTDFFPFPFSPDGRLFLSLNEVTVWKFNFQTMLFPSHLLLCSSCLLSSFYITTYSENIHFYLYCSAKIDWYSYIWLCKKYEAILIITVFTQ